MRLVRCPQCGHENRVSIVVTICDRCGEDISTLQPVGERSRTEPEPGKVARPADGVPPTPPTRPVIRADAEEKGVSTRGVPLSLLGRVVLAAVALVIGFAGSQNLQMGTAMASDPQIAGSVAILAVAAAVSGLVVLLVGSGSPRSESVGPAVRALGFLLACFGTLAAIALVTEGKRELPRPEAVTTRDVEPGPMPMGPPVLDPETGEPRPDFHGFPGPPLGMGEQGSARPVMPQPPPAEPSTRPEAPPP